MWEKCSVRGTSVDKVGKKGTFYTIKSSRKEVQVMAHYKFYFSQHDFFNDFK